jgi:hypothetical protein
MRAQWYEVYDLLEFVVARSEGGGKASRTKAGLTHEANALLERELSAFRFVQRHLVRLSNRSEIESIEEAVSRSARTGLAGVQTHLDAALALLGQKPTPDYRNAIKEAISAVESAVKCIAGSTGGGLDSALRRIDKHIPVHGALKAGFLSLYGFTSDEDGIRHAILDESNVGYDEAKFMLVACSAFVNFLISKAEAAGVLKPEQGKDR